MSSNDVKTISPEDAVKIIGVVSEYADKMYEIFESVELPEEVNLSQVDVTLAMMNFILLVNSKVPNEVEDY